MDCWRKCISGAPIKALFAFSSLLLVGSCALGGNENVVTVYFVTFEIETYVPITTATIVNKQAKRLCTLMEKAAAR